MAYVHRYRRNVGSAGRENARHENEESNSKRWNKYISYRRETGLQSGLVLAKSERLELGDNILRTLWRNQSAPKAIEFRKTTRYKGYYVIQGHSRSTMSVLIESPYATSC